MQTAESQWISGEPSVWLGSGEKEWKSTVTAALESARPEESPQWIDIEFRLLEGTLYGKDLDNLVTPILESARDGGWVERGFARLGTVTARKVAVTDSSAVGVAISPHADLPATKTERAGVLLETALPSLDEVTVKWALYENAIELYQRRPELRFPPQSPIAIDVRVTVNDSGRRKSIGALMKPCIDGLEPILGHPSNLLPEPRESLQRRLAPQDEMVLSLAVHVRGGPLNRVSVLISPAGQTSSGSQS